MLSTEYLATHIQNGLVVDIQPQSQQPPPSSQSQQHGQQNTIGTHNNLYGSSDGIDSNSPLEMTTERHFIAGQDVSTIPMDNIQHTLHQSNHSMHSHHHHHRSNHHFESSSNGIDDVVDRKVIIGEPGRQYIMTNEAQVIVSNKEVSAALAMNDLDLANSFPNSFGQMDHTMLQEITKTSPSRLEDQHDLDAENQVFYSYINLFIHSFRSEKFN